MRNYSSDAISDKTAIMSAVVAVLTVPSPAFPLLLMGVARPLNPKIAEFT
jgi:hypothetical protein